MLDDQAIVRLINIAIHERDAIHHAITVDARDHDLQERIANWIEGGYPSGKTAELFSKFRKPDGNFRRALQQANADVQIADLGAFYLPKLEALDQAHEQLLLQAFCASQGEPYDIGPPLEAHGRALSVLIDLVQAYKPDIPRIGDDRVRPTNDFAHSPDFRSVLWFGESYTFTTTQAACVQVMWRNWEQGTPVLSEVTILDEAGSAGDRLRDVFDKGNHPAWGTMIKPAGKGAFQLAEPDES